MSGLSGDNLISGTSSNDKLTGGSGSDTLDGGAGSDSLNAGSGNDFLVYTLSQNTGATDLYMGGSGIDTVRIQLTSSEWASAVVQTQLAHYFQHLEIVKTSNKGEVSNGSASDFTFSFAANTKLTVSMMENLEVYVDGVQVTNLDRPYIASATATGAVTEDGLTDANPATLESASGAIQFFDLDFSDNHLVSVVPPAGGSIGLFNASISNSASGDGQGIVSWTYQLNSGSAQYLAAGEVRTEVFTVRIADSDNSGNFVEQAVTVTVTGTNDGPTISVADAAGAVTEDASSSSLSDTGTITFDDVDLSDGHTVGVAAVAGNPLGGALLAQVTDAATGAGDGTVTWTYTLANSAAQYLAEGETASESFTVTIDDGQGGTVAQVVTVTVTGTNDRPTLTIDDTAADLTEGNGPALLSDSGVLSFADLDATDLVTVSQSSNGDIAWSGGTLDATVAAALVAGFSVGQNSWDYSASQNLDFLATGETITFSYSVVATDDSGAANAASAPQTVTITITGTNDGPTAVGDTATTLEDASVTFGVLANDSDPDSTDVLSVTAAAISNGGLGSVSVNADSTLTYNPGTAYDYLAVGESALVEVTYQISDGHGGTASTLATVTVTGTNDAPTISVADAAGAVTEDASSSSLSDTGTITFDDVDLSDGHTVGVAAVAGNPLGGALLAQVTDAATGAGDGTVTWTYTLANSAAQYLAEGETASESFTVTIDDGHGGTVAQVVTVTVTGTNDAPAITVEVGDSASAELVETNAGLLASETLTVTDVDTIDNVTVSTVSVAATGTTTGLNLTNQQLLDMFSVIPPSTPATPGSAGNAAWSFNSGPHAFDYLAAGQQLVLTYMVGATDGLTNDDQAVTITITGTEDVSPNLAPTDIVWNAVQHTDNNGLPGVGLLANLDSIDPDDSGGFAYSLQAGSSSGFTVSTSGAVTRTGTALDTNSTYTLNIRTQDSSGASFDEVFNIITGNNGVNDLPSSGNGDVGDDVLYGDNQNDLIYGGSGNDTLFGQAGDDQLDGGSGADSMYGGSGSDTYVVDNNNDVVNENISGSGGTDTVESSISYALGSGVENLTLTGTSGLDGTGNNVGNTIQGNAGSNSLSGEAGNDRLSGGGGNDVLMGGAGSNTFVFNSALSSAGVDVIQDFAVNGGDLIELENAVFNVGSGLDANEFTTLGGTGATANVASAVRIIYDSATGNLFYDADGGSSANRTGFADLTITDGGTLTRTDFSVV